MANKGGGLNRRQIQFAMEFCVDQHVTNAAIRAGYSEKSAAKIGSDLYKKPEILQLINKQLNAVQKTTAITVERTLLELGRLAFADTRKLFDKNGNLIPVHELDDDTAACIAGIEVVQMGGDEGGVAQIKKYKLNDKNTAITNVLRHLGLFNDKIKIETPDIADAIAMLRARRKESK